MLQTTFLLVALVISIYIIFRDMHIGVGDVFQLLQDNQYTQIFNLDWRAGNFYWKQILGGMFITITMTGLDQDMMQKNLTCKNLKEAQKNMMSFSGTLVFVNALFLILGGLLLVFANQQGIDLTQIIAQKQTDRIFPMIALNHLGLVAAGFFVIGLISAGYSSADGTFAAITTSFCYDIIDMNRWTKTEQQRTRIRRWTHVGMSLIFLTIILIFSRFHNDSLIRIIFMVAGYTYGPILGLFAFGMFSNRSIRNQWIIPTLSILTPVIVFFISKYSTYLFDGYKFGFELIILNGALMMLFLFLCSTRKNKNPQQNVILTN